jgi:drug/metabolite transporter (DMT)-like permease
MIQSEKNMSLVMILVPFVWALSGISAKYLSFYISEDEIVVYRFFLSVLSIIPLLWWMKIPMKISFVNFLLCILLGLFMIGNYRFYFMGMQRGAAGLGSALVTVLIPIFVYVLMIFSKKSKPLIKDWVALLVGVIGVLFMMNFEQSNLKMLMSGGNQYFVLAALTYALVTVVGAYMREMHVLAFNFYICLFALIIDWNLSYDSSLLLTLTDMNYVFWINILFVSVIAGTAITTIYYTGLRVLGSKKSSAFSLLTPFFAIAFGAIFFGETLTIKNAIGIIMAVFSLFVLNDLKIKIVMPFR